MTCVVGVQDATGVWMGADSLGANEWAKQNRTDGKLFRRGHFLIGFTDSFRMGQLLRYRLVAPCQPDGQDDHEYMATAFIDAVRTCLKDGGYAKKDSDQESGGSFLVAYRGLLYEVCSDYQVALNREGYGAVGSGYAAALGSLATCARLGIEAQRACLLALEAAERHSRGVRGPFSLKRSNSLEVSA